MQADLIRIIKKRRDDVHRRISELRAQLEVQEARAEELEAVLKETLASERTAPGPAIISPPKIATRAGLKANMSGVIVTALKELEGAGYEAADREAIFKIVRRFAPKAKQNTLRVALIRLTDQGRIDKVGNLYQLRGDGAAAS